LRDRNGNWAFYSLLAHANNRHGENRYMKMHPYGPITFTVGDALYSFPDWLLDDGSGYARR